MNRLGMFAKYWEPGRVKTRLAAEIGESAAARVYRAFVTTLVDRLGGAADECVLSVTPDERVPEFTALAAGRWTVVPQGDGDLGWRMRRFFESAFREGADRVLLIGSDSPSLPISTIGRALELLDQSDIVLGPTCDGGYYLVAARHAVPPIFEGIRWSTPAVWNETMCCLRAAGMAFAELPVWYDVDTRDDLNRLRQDLSSGGDWQTRLSDWIDDALGLQGASE